MHFTSPIYSNFHLSHSIVPNSTMFGSFMVLHFYFIYILCSVRMTFLILDFILMVQSLAGIAIDISFNTFRMYIISPRALGIKCFNGEISDIVGDLIIFFFVSYKMRTRVFRCSTFFT